jgi:hypothetical protein
MNQKGLVGAKLVDVSTCCTAQLVGCRTPQEKYDEKAEKGP